MHWVTMSDLNVGSWTTGAAFGNLASYQVKFETFLSKMEDKNISELNGKYNNMNHLFS